MNGEKITLPDQKAPLYDIGRVDRYGSGIKYAGSGDANWISPVVSVSHVFIVTCGLKISHHQ